MKKIYKQNLRYLFYMTILFSIFFYRYSGSWYWTFKHKVKYHNFIAYSNDTSENTQKLLVEANLVLNEYVNFYKDTNIELKLNDQLLFHMKIYETQEEFKRYSPVYWAEGYYQEPYSNFYLEFDTPNPYHGMRHEVIHQFNTELMKRTMPVWLNEGMACYFSTCMILNGKFEFDKIDYNSYPAWWLKLSFLRSGNLEADKKTYKVIPLIALLQDQEPINITRNVNLYYLHWWTFFHFLVDGKNGKYKQGLLKFIQSEHELKDFKKLIGEPIQLEKEWYEYLKTFK
ncbi:MAG: hypothetical protein COA79_20595 [Planctomycetota bacterium]|nr:MAG: hypothetical protein COA79_20595 [Planctomycetota bacterium]